MSFSCAVSFTRRRVYFRPPVSIGCGSLALPSTADAGELPRLWHPLPTTHEVSVIKGHREGLSLAEAAEHARRTHWLIERNAHYRGVEMTLGSAKRFRVSEQWHGESYHVVVKRACSPMSARMPICAASRILTSEHLKHVLDKRLIISYSHIQ
jgi:hypothetical protein